ncbi:MAG: response regulator [Gammaproteobacteria bacterium]
MHDMQVAMADGLLWIEFSMHPVFNAEGKVIQVVGEGRDVSKRLQQEEQLRRSQKMDALGKITGGVAHDYNNMLGIIIGYADLLKFALSEQPKLEKYAHEIHHAAERSAKLTQKLLAFSRQKSSDAEAVNLSALLRENRHMIEKTLTARIKLEFDLTDEVWPVWLDSGDLGDALINLSINAMHAIEGNGLLSFRTSNEQLNAIDAKQLDLDAGDYVLLSITDTGCGMEKEILDNIFDPFFSTKGEQGTGLGLSQVYGFMERSDGSIKVYSEPGHGTRMSLYFPRYTEYARDNNAIADVDSSTDSSGNESILIVDDEPSLLNLTADVLEQEGYSVFCSGSAEQALDILKEETIDLLLSDVIMPEMDGYQLAAIVAKKYPSVKIQLISGFSDNYHANLIDDGVHHRLIQKPFKSQVLLKRVRALLDDESN